MPGPWHLLPRSQIPEDHSVVAADSVPSVNKTVRCGVISVEWVVVALILAHDWDVWLRPGRAFVICFGALSDPRCIRVLVCLPF